MTSYFVEEFNMKRGKAAVVASLINVPLVVVASLSLGQLGHIQLFHCNIFDFLDKITSQIFMPLGGLLICTFVGWDMNKKLVASELNSRFTPLLMILFSWVAPIGIGIIFVYGLISG